MEQKKAVLLCRSESGDKGELLTQTDRLYAFAEKMGWKIEKIYSLTGKMGGITLWDLRLKARYKEYDYLLIDNFDVFSMPPDEAMEEVRYLIENGVEIRTLSGETLTCESLPALFRQRFKLFVGGKRSVKGGY